MDLTYTEWRRFDKKLDKLLAGQARIESNQAVLFNQGANTMATLNEAMTAAEAEAERNTTVDASVKALLTNIAAQLAAAKADPARIQAIADKLKGDNDSLAEAVAANTTAENEPPAPPVTA